MSYSAHTINASGTTYAQLKAGGVVAALDRIKAANAGVLDVPLASDTLRAFQASGNPRIGQAIAKAGVAVDRYLHGDLQSLNPTSNPGAVDATTGELQALADAFRAYGQVLDELAALIDANPGTVQTVTIGGELRRRRVLS